MDDEALDPYYSSATVGTYRPNTILTRMKSEADLNPEFGEVAPIALPAHVHEYIHHLHNYTTLTGVLQFYCTFLMYRLFVEGVNKDGEFSPAATTAETQNQLIDTGSLLVSIDGTCAHRPKNPLPRSENSKWAFTAREKKKNSFVDIFSIAVTGSVSSTHNAEYFEFTVGHTFLTEGVAYCIDREIRRNQGVAEHMLDFGVPAYPYLAYRPLLNHLVGRDVTIFEEISIGVAAMMGRSLIDICNYIKESVDTDNTLPSIIRQAAQELNDKVNARMLSLLKQTRSEFSKGDHLFSAFNQLITLIDEGQNLRFTWPALERSFIEKQLDKDTYPNLIATLLDVCIMQEKPDQGGEFFWGGSGRIAGDDTAATNLAVLQASIHFMRLHLKRNGNLGSTTELQFERCPFSGACATEKELNNPEVCIKTPWRRFSETKANNLYCWYAAGISVLTSRRTRT